MENIPLNGENFALFKSYRFVSGLFVSAVYTRDSSRWMFLACKVLHSRIFIQRRIVYSFFRNGRKPGNGVSKASDRAKITDQSARGTRSGGSRESPTPSSRKSILAQTLLKSCLRFTFAVVSSGRVKSHLVRAARPLRFKDNR